MAAKIIQFAGIAQLVERHIRNVEVLGSTPSTGTTSPTNRDTNRDTHNSPNISYIQVGLAE